MGILDRFLRPKQPKLFAAHFDSAASALAFACKSLACELKAGATLPAVVLDAKVELGAARSINVSQAGIQTALLRVASSDGGFLVLASAASSKGPKLCPGDLVAWHAGEIVEDLKGISDDPRTQWAGLITATLVPEHTINKGWKVAEPFR